MFCKGRTVTHCRLLSMTNNVHYLGTVSWLETWILRSVTVWWVWLPGVLCSIEHRSTRREIECFTASQVTSFHFHVDPHIAISNYLFENTSCKFNRSKAYGLQTYFLQPFPASESQLRTPRWDRPIRGGCGPLCKLKWARHSDWNWSGTVNLYWQRACYLQATASFVLVIWVSQSNKH